REHPTPVAAPNIFAFNTDLAAALGLDLDLPWGDILSGNLVPNGVTPITQAYAGHQFAHWNPQLGDGRAVLLGEAPLNGIPHDIQLKGSGRTHWSRGGDGRAWIGPVLREYVISEYMHALGIPTTRALAAVTTGEPVLRDTGPLPGAILTRVARSHVRVGTFQYFAARQDIQALEALKAYTIARHYPGIDTNDDLLIAACQAQAQLVAQWMGVGFIHGVMNTDNAHVGGVTIDYGPCAFIDGYDPMQVYSSIDRGGRYAYGNQPQIAAWNMAQFATALLPLEPNQDAAIDRFTKIVNNFGGQFETAYQATFARKLGLDPDDPDTRPWVDDVLRIMAGNNLDFTNTFWALATGTDVPAACRDWHKNAPPRAHAHTPAIIPRNHVIEAMIDAAVQGDRNAFDALGAACTDPFTLPDDPLFHTPPTPTQEVKQTFCGT
ncbi:MAG: protein adenylyltransferase SelO family protein, partial [Pseudomonadota bacterium]